ncbi:thiamine phosphate synthase [Psychromicrobium lacuslunae]|uniref:thiamine phosphate synthase n=1 Tax=Psychromicrobium lacuslunae TaxID=1618207 RepID=UPI0009E50CC8|nr:thiamine phosphate synthase [Psychromicrobium lacuslunae]
MNSLLDASLYLCTDARTARGDLASFLEEAYAGGVDIIQLRDKQIEAAAELEALEVLRSVAERHGKLWAVNDRADIALLSTAPVLHLGQQDLPVTSMRQLLPEVLAGLSCHNPAQVELAQHSPVDYFCVGPLWATPTKPGRDAVGLELVEFAASQHSVKPWFAIGGIDETNIRSVLAAGASRVVVVRAITEASDPQAAAAELKRAIREIHEFRELGENRELGELAPEQN